MWLVETLGIGGAQQPIAPPLLLTLALKGRTSSRLKPGRIQDNPDQAKMLTPQPALLWLTQRTIPINCLIKLYPVLKSQLGNRVF